MVSDIEIARIVSDSILFNELVSHFFQHLSDYYLYICTPMCISGTTLREMGSRRINDDGFPKGGITKIEAMHKLVNVGMTPCEAESWWNKRVADSVIVPIALQTETINEH